MMCPLNSSAKHPPSPTYLNYTQPSYHLYALPTYHLCVPVSVHFNGLSCSPRITQTEASYHPNGAVSVHDVHDVHDVHAVSCCPWHAPLRPIPSHTSLARFVDPSPLFSFPPPLPSSASDANKSKSVNTASPSPPRSPLSGTPYSNSLTRTERRGEIRTANTNIFTDATARTSACSTSEK